MPSLEQTESKKSLMSEIMRGDSELLKREDEDDADIEKQVDMVQSKFLLRK